METARRPTRREMIKWMLVATAAASVLGRSTLGNSASAIRKGYGVDPDLIKSHQTGDLWPLILNEAERAKAAILCAIILPPEGSSPGADQLNVQDFIDEWISAPYPGHEDDCAQIREGLAWLDRESIRRFYVDFVRALPPQRNAICDDICHLSNDRPELFEACQFFLKFRDLTAAGYFTTPEGMKDLQYTGNVASATFEGPPPELLAKLGLL